MNYREIFPIKESVQERHSMSEQLKTLREVIFAKAKSLGVIGGLAAAVFLQNCAPGEREYSTESDIDQLFSKYPKLSLPRISPEAVEDSRKTFTGLMEMLKQVPEADSDIIVSQQGADTDYIHRENDSTLYHIGITGDMETLDTTDEGSYRFLQEMILHSDGSFEINETPHKAWFENSGIGHPMIDEGHMGKVGHILIDHKGRVIEYLEPSTLAAGSDRIQPGGWYTLKYTTKTGSADIRESREDIRSGISTVIQNKLTPLEAWRTAIKNTLEEK